MQILAKNIPLDITLKQLQQCFSKFGNIKIIKTSFCPSLNRANAVVTYFNQEAVGHATRVLSSILGPGQTHPGQMQMDQLGMKRSTPVSYSANSGCDSESSGKEGPRKRARQSTTPPRLDSCEAPALATLPCHALQQPARLDSCEAPALATLPCHALQQPACYMLPRIKYESPPMSPPLEQGVPSSSRMSDSIMSLCSLANGQLK
jgi:hypothetical protein